MACKTLISGPLIQRSFPGIGDLIMRLLLVAVSSIFVFGGCTAVLGPMGSGAAVTAEYIMTGMVAKTMCFKFDRTKKALLIALTRMNMRADTATEIEGGEEIVAKASELEVKVELKQITTNVTKISVRAGTGFLSWDKATAQEIVVQTDKIAATLPS
jgi:hypothetical protein